MANWHSAIMSNPVPESILAGIPSPCYILDEKLLIKNLELLSRIKQEAGIEILCALKGFAMWSTFPLIRKYLDGATASSLHEALLSHEEFGKPAHLCAPVYFDNEIDQITDISSHITFNSWNQYERFGQKASDKSLEIALRINPEYSEVETDLYNPCIPGSRLGITADNMPDELPANITGLHFHALCEQNADSLVNVLCKLEMNFDKHLRQVRWLNIGGGHHFTRKDYDIQLFIDIIKKFKKKYDFQVIAEPGEAIGWQTGYLLATVQDIIRANGFQTAMLDVSFSAHMPDCLEMPYKPMIYGESETGHAYRLGGHTCLAGDFMGTFYFPQPLAIGKRLLFDDMIHYTMVKTTTFNGVGLPSIGIIKMDGSFQLVKQFGYQDFKGRLS
jgi:carboxynorspermidine decarboxylase